MIIEKYEYTEDCYKLFTDSVKEFMLTFDGFILHTLDGNKRHYEKGPAIIYRSGTMHYYINGKRHRSTGPASISREGQMEYWVDGQRHRLDGPAIDGMPEYFEYWINGKQITKEQLPIK